MIRVVLGSLGGQYTASFLGSRVMILGDSLLVDGKRVARRRSWGRPGQWIDEHGRTWETIDYEAIETPATAEAAS